MRNVLIILLMLAILSCEQQSPSPYGIAVASYNGSSWRAQATNVFQPDCLIPSMYQLYQRLNDRGAAVEQLGFEKVPAKAGVYKFVHYRRGLTDVCIDSAGVTKVGANFFTLTEHGSPTNAYYVAECATCQNRLEITHADPSTGAVEGTFSVTLALENINGKPYGRAPDTIRFTDGRFKILRAK